jgi:hypothetical protein
MPRAWLTWFVVACGLAAAAVGGELRLTCEPGLDIYVDGTFMGLSQTSEHGLRLKAIDDRSYTVRLEKTGFAAKEFTAIVGPTPRQIVVGELTPEGARDPDGEQSFGIVEVTSNPVECTFKIAHQRGDKLEPILIVRDVPEGEQIVWLERYGMLLKTTVTVKAGATTRITADFEAGTVEAFDHDADETVPEPEPRSDAAADVTCVEYWVEALRTSDMEAIEIARKQLDEMGFPPQHQKLIVIEDDGVLPLYKLRVGPTQEKERARYAIHVIKQNGYSSAWILAEPCAEAP